MSIVHYTDRHASRLGARIKGAVIAAGDERWDEARLAYNLLVDQRPALVAQPLDEQDVAAIVRYAAANDLQVAAQRTGHNAAPLGSLDDVILVRTDAMQGVEIDAAARSARVRAGAKWANVVPRASELGLAALHGSTPDVSVVGYSLGGGVGWYGRKWGLSTNSVTAIELVTADGNLVRADHEHHPDLFWALRGGGGNFGVVTALEFRLYPVSQVYAGALFFPAARAADVLHAWREWTAAVPDEMTSVARVLAFPPLPIVPEPLRGNAFAIVEPFFLGSEADGVELTRALRELGPVMDTVAMVPPVGLSEIHMDPPDPLPYLAAHRLLEELPAKAVDDLVAVASPRPGSAIFGFEIRHTGGELGRSRPHHGALDALPGSYMVFGGGVVADEATASALEEELALMTAAVEPYEAGLYWNFAEEATDPAHFFSAETYRRLRAVKAQHDPDALFRANHAIPAA